jgi:hypothetical protein
MLHFVYGCFVPAPLLFNLVQDHARHAVNVSLHVNDRLASREFPGYAVQRFVGVFFGKFSSCPTEELNEPPAYSFIPFTSLGTLRMELVQKLVQGLFG